MGGRAEWVYLWVLLTARIEWAKRTNHVHGSFGRGFRVVHPSNLSPLGLASIARYAVLRMLRSEETDGRKKELNASSEGVKRKLAKEHNESEVKNNSNQNQSYKQDTRRAK